MWSLLRSLPKQHTLSIVKQCHIKHQPIRNIYTTFKTKSKPNTNNIKVGWLPKLKFHTQSYGDKTHTFNPNAIYVAGGCCLLAGGFVYTGFNNINDVTKRINATYCYVLGGLSMTAASSIMLFKTRLPHIILSMNPMAFFGVNLVCSIGSLVFLLRTDYNANPVMKHVAWTGFNVVTAGALSIVGFFATSVIAQAALATGCIIGGISMIGATINHANPDNLTKLQMPLGIGLGVVVAAGLGSILFPISLLENIWLYGGLAIFGCLTATDTNELIERAKHNEKYDPINESLSIYLDTINIFIRLVILLSDIKPKQ